MIKKELSHIKNQFKKDRSTIKVNSVHSVYINGQSKHVLANQISNFDYLEDEVKELFLKNFKKALTGAIDVKVFDHEVEIVPEYLKKMADNSGSLQKNAEAFVEKFIENYPYDKNVVINIAQFTFYRSDRAFEMVIGTINKSEFGKTQYVYDHTKQNFALKNQLDPFINLSAPLDGFMYPVWEDDNVNTGKILYYSAKANKVNPLLLQNVLGCDVKLSAKQEKEYFHLVAKAMLDGKLSVNILQSIYEAIEENILEKDEKETYMIDYLEMDKLIKGIGADVVLSAEEAFKEYIGSSEYQFKGENVIPDFAKKSIFISNQEADIKINPNNIGDLKQTKDEAGNSYLVMRLMSELITDDFTIEFDKKIKIERQ